MPRTGARSCPATPCKHIHGEIEAKFAFQYAEREKALKAEYARKDKELDQKWEKLLGELHEIEVELDEERAEMAAVAEGRLPIEQGKRSHLFFFLSELEVEDLEACVDWDAADKARKKRAKGGKKV